MRMGNFMGYFGNLWVRCNFDQLTDLNCRKGKACLPVGMGFRNRSNATAKTPGMMVDAFT